MLTAQVEKFNNDFSEISNMLTIHYEELALNKDKVPLDPQWNLYDLHEQNDSLAYIALRESGELIGYVISIIAPGLHYKTCLTAHMDILFVRPDKRDVAAKGALLLVDTLEKELRRRGVQRWFMGTKLHKDIGVIFKRRKFIPVEMTYTKWLGD
jgi:hypothetical protein